MNKLTRGVITFVFDDGYQRVYENALPILNRHKMPGVFALPLNPSVLEASTHRQVKKHQAVRRWQDWIDVKRDGHEIASHSDSHLNLTTLSDAMLEKEMAMPAANLSATTFVYPGGAHDERVVNTARRYYRAARTIRRGFETIPPQDPYRLHSFNFSRNNFAVWKANLFALWAWLTNSWLIETYHMINGDDSEMVHTVKTEAFARHLRFVSRLPIAVKTIEDVMNP